MTWCAPLHHTKRYKKCSNFNISVLILIIFQIHISYSLKYIIKHVSAINLNWKMYGCDCLRTFGTTHVFCHDGDITMLQWYAQCMMYVAMMGMLQYCDSISQCMMYVAMMGMLQYCDSICDMSHLGLAFVLMLRPFFPELVMSTDLLSFEHPSVLLFYFAMHDAFCHQRYVAMLWL